MIKRTLAKRLNEMLKERFNAPLHPIVPSDIEAQRPNTNDLEAGACRYILYVWGTNGGKNYGVDYPFMRIYIYETIREMKSENLELTPDRRFGHWDLFGG